MIDCYLGEIRLFGADWAPWDWHICDGTLLPIEQYSALYTLIGTSYGGDGVTNFALPDLRMRIPLGQSDRNPAGKKGGSERASLTVENLPSHRHVPACSTVEKANTKDATNAFWSASAEHGQRYGQAPGNIKMNGASILPEGADETHENRMPIVACNYIIALTGMFPSPGDGGNKVGCLGVIRMFAFPFEIGGYAVCDGRTYSVSHYRALHATIGNVFGEAEGVFKIPDLRDRVLIGNGVYPDFSVGGEEVHMLSIQEIPPHRHHAAGSSNGSNSATPQDHYWPSDAGFVTQNNSTMTDQAIETTGSNVAHNNMSPYLAINYSISLNGIFPKKLYEGEEYIGVIQPFCEKLDPQFWLPCDGRELLIEHYQALHGVIRTYFGGNGTTTFALPDLRGHAVTQYGYFNDPAFYRFGQKAGSEAVTLTVAQMPRHSHAPLATARGNSNRPDGQIWANEDRRPPVNCFASEMGTGTLMNPAAISEVGGGKPHNNMMPYQAIEFMICCQGLFPPRG